MIYSFDTEIAKIVGVNSATIYHNIQYWCLKNKANNKNFYDGKYWCYNSVSAWGELFPFLTARQIRTAIDKLVENELIETGCYNNSPYDRTKWYRPLSQIDLSEMSNVNVEIDKPIPNSKPLVNTNNKKTKAKKETDYPFELFWGMYDKKVGKPKCEKKYEALNEDDRKAIFEHLHTYVKATPDKKYRKNPETYLNNRSWEDEVIIENKQQETNTTDILGLI